MTERFKTSLLVMWLLVSAVSMILPIFLPSASYSVNPATNVIGTATATMFILSFPSSLFGIPLLVIVDYALGVDPNSIQGMYVNLFLLFVLGSLQWFWIVPRVWRRDPAIQVLAIPDLPIKRYFPGQRMEEHHDLTPLERVISEVED